MGYKDSKGKKFTTQFARPAVFWKTEKQTLPPFIKRPPVRNLREHN